MTADGDVLNPLSDPPERVAVVGDWHANGAYARDSIAYARALGADIILHTGDFGYTYRSAFLRTVSDALSEHGLDLGFVDGNHESFPRLYSYPVREDGLRVLAPGIYHLPRGFRWQWNGLRLLALGGAHSVDRPLRRPHISWWPEETLTAGDVVRAVRGGPVDVMITHDCPAGVDIPGLSPHLFAAAEIARAERHRQLLAEVVTDVQPYRLVHGHYHVSYDTVTDLGYGPLHVTGLDCDGSDLGANVRVYALHELAARP